MKKKNPIFTVILLFITVCVVCGAIALGINASEKTNVKTADQYFQDYGGKMEVYVEILSLTNCSLLQEKFNLASANNNRATPGTNEYEWTLGYMKVSDDRMKAIDCYQ